MNEKNPITAKDKQPLPSSETVKTDEQPLEVPRDLGEAVEYVEVDDEVWDAVVAEIMEEYDGAWTRLADL